MDLHVEADPDPGQLAAHAGGAPGGQPRAIEILDVEVDRGPAPDRVGVRQHLEHLVGLRLRLHACRPLGHDSETATAGPAAHRPGRGFEVILADDAGAPPRRYFDPVSWLRSMHARVRAMDPFRADVALAALVVVASAIEVVARLLMKLEVRDRVQAVVLAYESGVVAPGDAASA
jgi:hypothetical protein